MERKEAFSIAEEILGMLVSPQSHFQEDMSEYICDKLDISYESLAEVLNIISKENDESGRMD